MIDNGKGSPHQADGAPRSAAATDTKLSRFFEAAEPLFERFGYRKTTIEDVCRAAGMSKRTFYELFRDKQDLLLQLAEGLMNRMTVEWEASIPPGMNPLSRLHSLLDLYANMIRRHPFFQATMEDVELMRSFGQHLDKIRMAQMGGPFDQLLRDGIAAGEFRPVDPHAAMWIVLGLLDTMYLLMPAVMNVPGPLDDPVLAREVRQFIVRGLGAIDSPATTDRPGGAVEKY
jgi:AcrR family transcriptional regulator